MRLWPFNAYVERGLVWVRFFGYGLLIKNTRRHPLMFSEREGKNTGLFIRALRRRQP